MKKILLFLMLAGCSFQPVFSGGDTDVYVAPINGINGIELRNSLNAQFGGAHEEGAKYTLNVDLRDPVKQYEALKRTGSATWQEVKLNASYVLTEDGKEIARGSESASESYAIVGYLVAANASYNNAVLNAINVLSERISMHVIAETRKDEFK